MGMKHLVGRYMSTVRDCRHVTILLSLSIDLRIRSLYLQTSRPMAGKCSVFYNSTLYNANRPYNFWLVPFTLNGA